MYDSKENFVLEEHQGINALECVDMIKKRKGEVLAKL